MNPPDATAETVVWSGTPSQWTHFGTYLFCLLLAALVVVAYLLYSPAAPQPLILTGLAVPALWALGRWIGTKCHRYEITTERAKLTTGLLSRQSQEIELYRVRDYTVVEPFWLRLVGCGDVILTSADRSSPSFVLRAVPRARWLKDEIRKHTERMRQRRGVRDLDLDPRGPSDAAVS